MKYCDTGKVQDQFKNIIDISLTSVFQEMSIHVHCIRDDSWLQRQVQRLSSCTLLPEKKTCKLGLAGATITVAMLASLELQGRGAKLLQIISIFVISMWYPRNHVIHALVLISIRL